MSVFGIYFTSIPRPFWSEYSGQPFVKCLDCEVPLIESNAYIIQKRFVGGETVFEMAMCERCRESMASQYSEETRRKITAYMSEQFLKLTEDLSEKEDGPQLIEIRELDNQEEGEAILAECMDRCLVCSKERAKCHRYSMAGLCRDSDIVVQVTPISRTPLMICDDCELGMADLVSKQTRDAWDKFIEEHFDGPPGIEVDSPSNYPIAF